MTMMMAASILQRALRRSAVSRVNEAEEWRRRASGFLFTISELPIDPRLMNEILDTQHKNEEMIWLTDKEKEGKTV